MKSKFGTAPVFFTAISTILGAVMFLRFGYALGNVGFLGTVAIILIGHAVTIPTAMAIAEIATNQKVEGGGEYYILSRSFGLVIGSSIGIALFLSQAISVAFYIIAFSESFSGLIDYINARYPNLHPIAKWFLSKKQTLSIPALLILTSIVLTKGADLGVKALYVVVATLTVSMVAFFLGTPTANAPASFEFNAMVADHDSFFMVFAIIFPAFTGMTAGVGLSGDLQDPGKSIPLGTLAGTLSGMVIYFFIAYKLTTSASPQELADTSRLVMADIAQQGYWLIPLGLAAATISSALGSLMVAPRTLQAIAKDRLFPTVRINSWLSMGRGKNKEPYNASLITISIAIVFIFMGGLDVVAEIISMFFMVTYGALCLISFLQHFAADPSYRPTFRSRWYISLFGAFACFGLMFFINALYAVMALVFMGMFYVLVSQYNPDKNNMAVIFQGAIFQLSRQLRVFLQKTDKEQNQSWRPSVVCISRSSFERYAAFDLMRWISQKYGFGTYIHLIDGYLSKENNHKAKTSKERLIKMAESNHSNLYIDTLISPSFTSAVAQVIQLPGVSGKENNLLMFEFSKHQTQDLTNLIDNYKLIKAVDFDVITLGSAEKGFGFRQRIHIWITSNDYENANLMILLAYIIAGHKEWNESHIHIFAIYPEETCSAEKDRLYELIYEGKLPISKNDIKVIPQKNNIDTKRIIEKESRDADLTIIGYRKEALKNKGQAIFEGYEHIGNTLFVSAAKDTVIK